MWEISSFATIWCIFYPLNFFCFMKFSVCVLRWIDGHSFSSWLTYLLKQWIWLQIKENPTNTCLTIIIILELSSCCFGCVVWKCILKFSLCLLPHFHKMAEPMAAICQCSMWKMEKRHTHSLVKIFLINREKPSMRIPLACH